MIVLDDTKQIVCLDVKSLFTYLSVSEVIEIALTFLYSGDHSQDIEKSA